MLLIQESNQIEQREGACSDCGRATNWRTPYFDQGTHSLVKLCPTCAAAFRQRQQFSQGCCGEN